MSPTLTMTIAMMKTLPESPAAASSTAFRAPARPLAVQRRAFVPLLAVMLAAAAPSSHAQVPAGPPASAASAPQPAGGGGGVLRPGQQPGQPHPLAQPKLGDLPGAVPWSLLASVPLRNVKGRLEPDYPAEVKAWSGKTAKVQGFMIPLSPGERQTHFLLTNVPTTCSFCMPAGPEGLVEVRAKTPVRYGFEPVLVEGRFAVLERDPSGLFYRLSDAQPAEAGKP
jgi:hypothetical protein